MSNKGEKIYLSPKLIERIALVAEIPENEADLFFECCWDGYKNGSRGNALWARLCDHYAGLRGASKADKDELLKFIQTEIRKKGKEWKEQKERAEFNLEEALKEAQKEDETPKYHGPINFDPELGIFYTVPVEIPPPSLYKPVLHNGLHTFAQEKEAGAGNEIMSDGVSDPRLSRGVFAQGFKEFGGVQTYLGPKQRISIRRLLLSRSWEVEKLCKSLSEELEMMSCYVRERYFKYEYDIEAYLLSCWAIGTYLFPMFPVYPYLIFVGEKGTNKSGQLAFLSRVCWNPTSKLSLPSEASIFRLIHQAKPTMLIDEVHRLLHHPLYGPLLQALLESGHERGGQVPRVDDNDRDKINFYDVYSPKAMASREALELEEKSITIVLHKTYDEKYAIARANLELDPKFDEFQEALLKYALIKWKDIYQEFLLIKPTPKLAGRYFLLWQPILAICKITYPERYNELLAYAEQSVMGVEKKSYEVEIHLLSFLATRLYTIKAKGNALLSKEITEPTGLSWQAVRSALRNLGLIKADRDTQEGKKYYLHVDKIEQLAKERSITTEDENSENVCDGCGNPRPTTLYNGQQLCADCIEKELNHVEELPDEFDSVEFQAAQAKEARKRNPDLFKDKEEGGG